MFSRSSVQLILWLIIGLITTACSSGKYTTTMKDADLKRTAAYPGAAPILETVDWKFEAESQKNSPFSENEDNYGEIKSPPAIADGVVYIGSFNGNLYALNLNTGEEIWTFETQASIESKPAVADSTVFFDSGGTFYAVDTNTAEEKWRYEDGLSKTHPLVHEGTVFFGDLNGHLYAIDQTTGEEQWRFDAGSAIRHPPAISDERIYVINAHSELYSIRLDSGELDWNFSPDVDVENRVIPAGSPVVSDEIVYIGHYRDHLHAFDKNTGEEQWMISIGEVIHRSPTIHNGLLYVRTLCDGKTCINALEKDTGNTAWHSQFDVDPRVTALSSSDGTVYFGGDDGLYSVDGKTGKQTGYFATENGVQSPSVIYEGRIFFSTGRYLYVVE